jgi:ferredoxin
MEGLRPTFEVRIHGRGGQGVVTAAELLSVAAFDEGLSPTGQRDRPRRLQGRGLCVAECPCGAIEMIPEQI